MTLKEIPVYAGPQTDAEIIGTIEMDERVGVDEVRGDWARIYYKGDYGFVLKTGMEPD